MIEQYAVFIGATETEQLASCAACGLRQELARPVIRLAAEELEKYAQGI